jgi:CHAT domain-containing protein/tetratricopeptide (TPR) repeat protein
MKSARRVGQWLFVLSLLLSDSPLRASVLLRQDTADEFALRTLAQTFFQTWAALDLDGFLRLWSAQSPEVAARRKSTTELFASQPKITLNQLEVRRVSVTNGQARVRIAAEVQVLDAQTGQARPGYGKLLRTLECSKEEGVWRVQRELSTFDELAARLSTMPGEAERAALLTEEKEWITPELVRALTDEGNRIYEQGNFAEALALHRTAHRLAEQLGDQPGLARALNSIGNLHWVQGDYGPALTSFQQSLALSERLGDRVAVAGTLRNLGNLAYAQGDWDQALELFRKGTQMSEVLNDRLGLARGLASLGVVTDSQGNFAEALEYYQRALSQFEALDDKLGMARTLGNIAIVYDEMDNYGQALDYHQRSLALFEAKGDQAGSARTLHNIALVHWEQGDYAQALAFGQKSLQIREKLGDKPGMAKTLEHLGNVYFDQGHYEEALAYYQKSLALCEAMKNKEGIASALTNLGSVALERGQSVQALEHFQQSLALREAVGYKMGVASTLGFLAYAHRKQGQHAQALSYAERAAALARQIGDNNTLRQALYTIGTVQRALKQPAQARRAFEEAISIIENLRTQIAGGEDKQQRYFESKLSPYHALIDLLITQDRPAEALTFAERTKGRALLDVLRQGRLGLQKAMTAAEREQERRLKAELTQLNAQLTRAEQAAQRDAQRIQELKLRLEKARLAYEAFQTTLYAAHPELKTQRGEAQIITTEELAALLPATPSALLEYVVTNDATYLFAVTKNREQRAEVRVYTLPIRRETLGQQIESFRRQLAGRDLGFRIAARQLYELLLKPAQAQLRGATSLVIVPDDKLWELPFQALLADNNRYVVEERVLAYAPSLTVLREMTKAQRQPGTAPTLLALGNPQLGQATVERAALALRSGRLGPLPEAEAEVKALGALYGATRSKIYTGPAAREDRTKSEAAHARVLHFATHGVLNDAAPLYSHLVLSQGDTREDGLLEAWELMQLELQADLAVLSACETARGRIGAGEGMIGLTWALFVAGVPATVVSQWKVESAATRELMLAFHRQLQAASAQTTKAAALRQAALSLLKKPATSHPFYWAGFVLVGDGR